MKRLLLMLLVCSGVAVPQPSGIASRRYAERTPLQYTFPSFKQMGTTCYNNPAPIGPTVTLACLQPSSVLLDQNNFAATANFTTVVNQGAGGTFSATGGVGTFTTPTTSADNIWVSSNASLLPFSSQIVSTEVLSNGTDGTINIGYSDATGANAFYCGYRSSSAVSSVNVVKAGVVTTTNVSVISPPSPPYYFACALTATHVAIWLGNSSGVMTQVQYLDVSSTFDPRTITFANYKAFVGVSSRATSSYTFTMANLWSGGFGGVGLHSMNPVTYSDGRPYMQGSKLWIYTPISGSIYLNWDACGIFSYDLVSGSLTLQSLMGVTYSSGVSNYCAGNIIYEPATGQERLTAQTDNVAGSSLNIVYTTQSISTDDWFGAAKYHITPAVTQMTLPTGHHALHPFLACTVWGYSTLTCGRWEMAWADINSGATASNPAAAYSTSDPSANTWTSIFSDTTHADQEGTFTLRAAVGSAGTAYYDQWVQESSFTFTYNEDALNFADAYLQGSYNCCIPAPWPGNGAVPPNPFLLSYGNNEYAITTGSYYAAPFGGAGESSQQFMGRPVIASTQKYAPQANWPVIAAATAPSNGSGASITSASITVTSGDWVTVFCSGTESVVPVAPTISSSLSMGSFTSAVFNLNPTGTDTFQQLSYVKATAGGSSTVTCTPAATTTTLRLTVLVAHPGFTSTVDTISPLNTASSIVYTSPTFSTTGAGLVIVCARSAATPASNGVPGSIGPYVAIPQYGFVTGNLCMAAVTEGAQSNITATTAYLGYTAAAWGGAMVSFK